MPNIGLFHPLFVHFPITLFTIAMILDLVGYITKYRPLTIISDFTIVIGTLSLIPSIITGLSAQHSHDANDTYLMMHKMSAFLTFGYSLIHMPLRAISLYQYYKQAKSMIGVGLCLFLSSFNMILISITADFGGYLTYGQTIFLSKDTQKNENASENEDSYEVRSYSPESLKEYLKEKITFENVKFIFINNKCAKCHGFEFANVDGENFFKANGSKEAWIIKKSNGKIDDFTKSHFYRSVILENRMPIDEHKEVIGLNPSERLILFQWLKNEAPIAIKKEKPIEKKETEKSDNVLDQELLK